MEKVVWNMRYDSEKVERLKERYPEGTHIRLTTMSGEADMPSGLQGTVDCVDDMGQLQMKWDNGRSLALVPGEDHFTVISRPELRQGQKQKPDAPLIGANGNIFNLMGIASRTLKEAGLGKEANEMFGRASASGSYEEALSIIGEYVNFSEVNEPEQSENEAEQFGLNLE
ncbi:MAG: DUF4314 domain-containing protein [Desulfitobacterium hafniense]|nr:DUF4314 domain-containing protein [Desulfitobacterium hafniense]